MSDDDSITHDNKFITNNDYSANDTLTSMEVILFKVSTLQPNPFLVDRD